MPLDSVPTKILTRPLNLLYNQINMLNMKKLLLSVFTIFFLSMPFLAFSQTRQVSGIVSDESRLPLSLVSVVQKGTATGTTTNEKGEFTITVSGANPVLVFSHIDREPQEVAIG